MFDSDSQGNTWFGSITPGAKKTITWSVKYPEGDLDADIDINVRINNDLDLLYDGSRWGKVRVTSEDNVFRSGGGQEPEKDVYYVGETVTVTDTMRNSLTIEATRYLSEVLFQNGSSWQRRTETPSIWRKPPEVKQRNTHLTTRSPKMI